MLKRLLITFLSVLIIGGLSAYFGLSYLEKLRTNRQAAATLNVRQDITVTIVEGKRREEIAALLAQKGVCGYADFMTASQNEEGYLFPDTYRFFPDTPATQVVKTLTDNFAKRTAGFLPSRDQLALASIVEREGGTADERAQVAGVYSNRIAIGMRLDADPTVQYAKDSLGYQTATDPQNFSFWKAITRNNYSDVLSDYNTYLHTGFPPGPIANPGLMSIKAAMSPGRNNDYYFIFKNGVLELSQTLDQHEEKAQN